MTILEQEVTTPREAARVIATSYRARMPRHLCEILADEIERAIHSFVEANAPKQQETLVSRRPPTDHEIKRGLLLQSLAEKHLRKGKRK